MQLRWALSLVLYLHIERALEALGRNYNFLRHLTPDNSVLWRVSHLELSSFNSYSDDNLKVTGRHEVPDFQLALAHDCQSRRLHSTYTDYPARAATQDDGCGTRQRQIVDLVGLPSRDGGGVKAGIFGVWLCSAECFSNGLRILRGEQNPHDLAAIGVMLENFLTDELTLTIAIGGEPDFLCAAQRLSNGFELSGFVTALRRACAVQAFGPQKDWRPAFPGRHNIFRFEQVEQVAFGRENVSVAGTNSGTDIFRLAGLLGDDNLTSHDGLVWRIYLNIPATRTYREHACLTSRHAAC